MSKKAPIGVIYSSYGVIYIAGGVGLLITHNGQSRTLQNRRVPPTGNKPKYPHSSLYAIATRTLNRSSWVLSSTKGKGMTTRRLYTRLGTILASFVVAFTLTSCGTLFCDYDQPPALTITSSVPNADVYINGKYVGKTPYSHFSASYAKRITVKKEGYKSKTMHPRKLKAWPYINLIPWPMYNWIWGIFLDMSKDACWKYKRDTFYFELEEKQ